MSSRRRGFKGTAENCKTKICLRWKSGHCRFGNRCNFAHDELELRRRGSENEGLSRSNLKRGHTDPDASHLSQPGQSRHAASSMFQAHQLPDTVAGSFPGAAFPLHSGPVQPMQLGPQDRWALRGSVATASLPQLRPDLAAPLDSIEEALLGGQGMHGQHAMPGNPPQSSELWAQQGYPIPGQGGWTQYRDEQTGDAYYHNQLTCETTWDPPPGWGVMCSMARALSSFA